MSRKFWIAIALLTCVACDKKEPAPADTAEKPALSAAPAEPAPVAAATPPPVDVASLPVEEEFEAPAEKELTNANLNAKLDELEKEISAP